MGRGRPQPSSTDVSWLSGPDELLALLAGVCLVRQLVEEAWEQLSTQVQDKLIKVRRGEGRGGGIGALPPSA